MRGSDLAALVRSYLDDDEVALLPDEPDRESRLNTWCYSIPDGPVDVAGVVDALHIVHVELKKRWSERPASGTFYAWYDEQAGQLRCSLTSAAPDRLPFRGRYRSTFDAAEVVALAAADPSPGQSRGRNCKPLTPSPRAPPIMIYPRPSLSGSRLSAECRSAPCTASGPVGSLRSFTPAIPADNWAILDTITTSTLRH
jgi:hypothetical protein